VKKISVVVPCYNDSNSIRHMRDRVKKVFETKLQNYDYEIIFVDDCSLDNTWNEIENVCKDDLKCKGVHNFTNFGPDRNIFQSMKYGFGDAVFMLFGDLQQPPEILPEFVKYWEDGYNTVVGIHKNTRDKGSMAFFRKIYYRFVMKASSNRLISNFDNFGLYDKKVIDAIRLIENVQPSIPGILVEYGGKIKQIEVMQNESERGKSNFNFFRKYDVAMVNITSYTKILLRVATFIGSVVGLFSVIFAIVAFCLKLANWDGYPTGIPSIIVGIFFLGGIQLFFLGIMGEYIMSINERSMRKPTVIYDKTINMDDTEMK